MTSCAHLTHADENKSETKMADRKRKQNWSVEESNVLTNQCVENMNLLTGKFSQSVTATAKKNFWQETCEMVNSCGGNERSIPEIMKKWADMKSKAKQAEIKRRACIRKTGGGPPPVGLAPLEEKIVSVFPKAILEGVSFGEDTFEAEKANVMQKPDQTEDDDEETEIEREIGEDIQSMQSFKGHNLEKNVGESRTGETQPLCKGHKKSKNTASDGCSELLVVERELLAESQKRNAILETIAEKMDCIIDLKKKKLDLMEKQYSIQNADVISEMLFES